MRKHYWVLLGALVRYDGEPKLYKFRCDRCHKVWMISPGWFWSYGELKFTYFGKVPPCID